MDNEHPYKRITFALPEEAPDPVLREKAEQSLRTKFRPQITSRFLKALKEDQLVKDGDRVAVCISGGKDSMLMAKLFQEVLRYSEVDFAVEFLVMDPGYSRENRLQIEQNAGLLGVPINIFETDIFNAVYTIEKSPCYLCARMRRGYLYRFAQDLNCNKIALGHHFDDVIETTLMGMLYGAQIKGMMPKLHSTNFPGMELIRPMYLIREDDIKAWRDCNGLTFLRCACRFTEAIAAAGGEEENPSKRDEIKQLIRELKKKNPHLFRELCRLLL
ncbi:MAG: tRNA 2-thiocytidine biosynthesis protein TtcA [Lachnospiraceae bacterium]|nr:tRNA 2-thiocytidine biosynthesis protein TtcA [Lachnospiraceae bacterium]